MPFITNEKRHYDEILFTEGQGIDFYIDGARFLPENTTYSRVVMRVLTIDQGRVVGAVKSGAHLDISTNVNPFYGFRFEIRGSPKIDPTAVVHATIETIDRSDGIPKVIGHAYFPLFLSQRAQNKDKSATSV